MPAILESQTIINKPVFILHFPKAIGAIRDKWLAMGGAASLLGQPITDELTTPDGVGRFNRFENGMIYWTPSTGAQEIHGAILGKWSSLGFERSFLGYPLSDEQSALDGVGRFNRFQNGVIYWTPSTGAHELHGAILGKWLALGAEQSFLGYPTSDEVGLNFNGGRFNNFQHGQIAWTPSSGAAVSSSSFHGGGSGGIRPKGTDGNGKPEVRRRVVLSAHMDITDDETFGSNEHGTGDGQTEGFVTNSVPRTLLTLIGKAGGEVRVELNLDATATTEGDIQISGTAKLFEGTSSESDDLDGTTQVNFAVPRDGIISQMINVRNTDEGGDFSDIKLVVSNFAA